MAYKTVTKINDTIIGSVEFNGRIENPKTHTAKPNKHCDYEYYYFIIDDRPYKCGKFDIMTIEQINL